jgi:hypothetical protein
MLTKSANGNTGSVARDRIRMLNGPVDSAIDPDDKKVKIAAILALVWTVGVFGAFLYTAVSGSDGFTGVYNASAYWVTYEQGFVRRGLIGSLAAALLGHPLDRTAATVLGVLIFVVGFAALVWLTRAVVERAERPVRLLAGAVVAGSPFSFSLLVQTRGRYDSILVACTVLVAISFLAAPRDRHRWWRIVAVAATNVVAVGAEEFALGFLAPLTVLGIVRMRDDRRRAVLHGAVALGPALLVTIASFAGRPRVDYLVGLTGQVRAAGFPLDPAQESSISALGQTMKNALTFTAGISPLSIAACTLVLGGCFVLSSTVLWVCCGQSSLRSAGVLMAAYAAVALTMSAVGDDYRRWWGLAFVAMTASTVLRAAGEGSRGRHSRKLRMPTRRSAGVLAVCLLVASAAAQMFPVWPSWDRGANTELSIDYIVSHS